GALHRIARERINRLPESSAGPGIGAFLFSPRLQRDAFSGVRSFRLLVTFARADVHTGVRWFGTGGSIVMLRTTSETNHPFGCCLYHRDDAMHQIETALCAP